MVYYKDAIVEESGSGLELSLYKSDIDNFNKFNIGGLVSLGLDIKELLYFEVEYNPNFTKNYSDSAISIRDNVFAMKLGLNID